MPRTLSKGEVEVAMEDDDVLVAALSSNPLGL